MSSALLSNAFHILLRVYKLTNIVFIAQLDGIIHTLFIKLLTNFCVSLTSLIFRISSLFQDLLARATDGSLFIKIEHYIRYSYLIELYILTQVVTVNTTNFSSFTYKSYGKLISHSCAPFGCSIFYANQWIARQITSC